MGKRERGWRENKIKNKLQEKRETEDKQKRGKRRKERKIKCWIKKRLII